MSAAVDRLRLKEDIVPVSTLQSATSRLLREVETQRRPKVITRDGVAVAVLIGVEEFERLQEDATVGSLLRDIRQAEAEIESGQGIPQEQLEQDFESRWGTSFTA
jgi:prevent-host-death family protein